MEATPPQQNKSIPKQILRWGLRIAKLVAGGPLFNDLMGRLTVLLHILVQLVVFGVVVGSISRDSRWWRSTALADSQQSCQADTTQLETLQLCSAFDEDLRGLMRMFATAVATMCFKLCTCSGALCCSPKLATSTRLDNGNWFSTNRVRRRVARHRIGQLACRQRPE